MADKKVVGWFTMNGKHIPVFEGESKSDAVKRSLKLKKPAGKDKQPVPKGYTDKKWKEFEEASLKADTMSRDIDYPEFAKKEREAARAFDKSVAQEREHGTISIKRKSISDMSDEQLAKKLKSDISDKERDAYYAEVKKRGLAIGKNGGTDFSSFNHKESTADKNEGIKNKQIAQSKEQADKAKGVTRKDIEELTAKKDSLKNANLKTKPITQKEIDAQKKTWASDKSSKDKYKSQSDINTAVFNHMGDTMFKLYSKYGTLPSDAEFEKNARRAYEVFFGNEDKHMESNKSSSAIFNALGDIAFKLHQAGVPSDKVEKAYKNFLKRFYDDYDEKLDRDDD